MFQLGQEVKYKGNKGIIDFVHTSYIGICVKECDIRLRCVRVLVYPEQWKEVIINNENYKYLTLILKFWE